VPFVGPAIIMRRSRAVIFAIGPSRLRSKPHRVVVARHVWSIVVAKHLMARRVVPAEQKAVVSRSWWKLVEVA
jgi:hypothetical protein